MRPRASAGAALLALLMVLYAPMPAAGHVAISLLTLKPREGERVHGDVDVEVYAQATLGGVPSTSFRLMLDGRSIDFTAGRPASESTEIAIHVGQTKRTTLRDVATGRHAITLVYKPDRDAPIVERTTTFSSDPTSSWRSWSIASIVALVVLALAGVLVRRHSMRGKAFLSLRRRRR